MHHWTKRLFAIAAPLLLTGCLWGPGKFASDLTVRKDGSFTLDYRGEIVLQLPADDKAEPWNPSLARCVDDDAKDRPCTAAEVAEQKADHDKQAAQKGEQAQEMAKAFGLPGLRR